MDTVPLDKDRLYNKHVTTPSNITTSHTEVNPLRKLLVSILLLGVMECETKFVRFRAGKRGSTYERQQISRDALEFVSSPLFVELCRLAGVSSTKLRRMTPLEARKLMSGNVYHRAMGAKRGLR